MCHPELGRQPSSLLTSAVEGRILKWDKKSPIQMGVPGEFISLECPFVEHRSLYVLFNHEIWPYPENSSSLKLFKEVVY